MLVNAGDGDVVEPGRNIDEDSPAFGEDRVVGGVPGHCELGCDD